MEIKGSNGCYVGTRNKNTVFHLILYRAGLSNIARLPLGTVISLGRIWMRGMLWSSIFFKKRKLTSLTASVNVASGQF